jgi:hypothetical protein
MIDRPLRSQPIVSEPLPVLPGWLETALAELDRLRPAARIAAIEALFAREGLGILDALVGPAGEVTPGLHYPPGEVWDRRTNAQWFFHAHEAADQNGHGSHGRAALADEYGHFHTFLGAGGMPPGIQPFVLPEIAMEPVVLPVRETGDPGTHLSRRDRGRFSHLIGLSVDARCRPVALFTTNRWVTGEVWYRAEDTVRMLDRFAFQPTLPPLPMPDPMAEPDPEPDAEILVSAWLAAVMEILRPKIAELLMQRDAAVMDWRRRRSRQRHVFEDRRLDVTSVMAIDFPATLERARLG